MSRQVLITTPGSEPEVITLALDLLQTNRYSVAEVIGLDTVRETARNLAMIHNLSAMNSVEKGQYENLDMGDRT